MSDDRLVLQSKIFKLISARLPVELVLPVLGFTVALLAYLGQVLLLVVVGVVAHLAVLVTYLTTTKLLGDGGARMLDDLALD